MTIAFALSIRLWALMPLYTDAALRSRTQVILQATAEREGWLLSGVSIQKVSHDRIEIQYRSYYKGEDIITCYVIDPHTAILTLCNDS